MDDNIYKDVRYDVSQLPPCPNGTYYTIRAGDTLYSLARRYNTSVDAILGDNPGLDPMNLQVGPDHMFPVAPQPVSVQVSYIKLLPVIPTLAWHEDSTRQ